MLMSALAQAAVSVHSVASTALADAIHGVLAAEPTTNPSEPSLINTDGIMTFIATKIAPILLAVLGVIFISRAGKGEMSKVLTSSAIAIVGVAFIIGGGALFFFGEGLIKLIFG
jgi:hypothetical protein